MAKCRDCEGSGLGMYVVTNYDCTALVWEESDCVHCDGTGEVRTGPYRLADGTWSDGVDRTKRINERYLTSRYEVTVSRSSKRATVWQKPNHLQGTEFPTWREAIAYADKQARTTKNGENNA